MAAAGSEYEQVTLDGLRPLAMGTLAIYALALPFDLAAPRVAGHDLLVLLVAAAIWLAAARERLPARMAAPATVAFALLVLSNVLLDRGGAPPAIYVGIILVAIGAFILTRRWMALGLLLVFGLWAITAGTSRRAQLGVPLLAAVA